MVQAIKGYLVECDIPTKQFLVSLNEGLPPSEQFIFSELDDVRLFVKPKRVDFVKTKLKAWYQQHTYEARQSKGHAH